MSNHKTFAITVENIRYIWRLVVDELWPLLTKG